MVCKQCKDKFIPKYFLQKWCLEKDECIKAFSNWVSEQNKKKIDKAMKKDTAERKEKLMTHKDHLKLLQVVFNTYIRLRDKDQRCISCDCVMIGRKGDASHYYSVGSTPALRFNEDNVHLSCVTCNQHKHGNIAEYAIRLPFRIGYHRFKALEEKRNITVKLTIDEIKEKITHYKTLTKKINK
jgi:hypothetical protein